MKCGNCEHTDGLSYLSDPPKTYCKLMIKYFPVDSECCCEEKRLMKEAELEAFKSIMNRPGALMAVNYDSDKAPAVTITGEEAALAYESLLKLPLHGECEGDRAAVAAYTAVGSTSCLVCGEEITVNMWDSYIRICPSCKKAIKFIKEKFNKELENYEM